jgi:hypothetical protein
MRAYRDTIWGPYTCAVALFHTDVWLLPAQTLEQKTVNKLESVLRLIPFWALRRSGG